MDNTNKNIVRTRYGIPRVWRDPLQSQLDNIFNQFFNSFLSERKGIKSVGKQYPKCDIQDNEKDYTIIMEIVGVSKQDIKIEYNHDEQTLYISGQKKVENTEKQDQNIVYILKQLKRSSFKRGFFISKEIIDIEKIKSTFKDGILTIIIPKMSKKEEKPSVYNIPIK